VNPERLSLDGLIALTDETGIFQHSKFSIIDREKGYTTDDNARALIAALLYHKVFKDPKSIHLANTYLSFLLHMQKDDGRFHNILGFDRMFKDKVGSEDCMGHALWATGYALNSHAPDDMKYVAKEIFDKGLSSADSFTSLRAWALTILGLHNYHRAFPNDQNIDRNIRRFSNKLVNRYRIEACEDWQWFESILTYSNPRPPQALFTAYKSVKEPTYLKVAKNTLDFLIEINFVEGMFIPIGTEGWYKRGGRKAIYDQQPIEASCMVEAALTAYRSTREESYLKVAQIAFDWYNGRNTQGVILFNDVTGACHDGITPKGLNQNQGAESTLSFYLAYLNCACERRS
jgi:hypothetical protein